MKSKAVMAALILALAVLIDACTVNEQVTRRSQLVDPIKTGTIRVMAKDSTLYELTNYRLEDSTLIGAGTSRKDGVARTFSGVLKFSDIAFIQSRHTSFWKGVIMAGTVVYFTTQALDALGGSRISSLSVREGYYYPPSPYGGGGSSCPFIYSWNGEEFVREAEAFGIGFGRALELTTCSVLPSLKEDHDQTRVRLTNERPETHYFNSVRLVAVETENTAGVVADAENILWPVHQSVPPVSAVDQSGNNVVEKIRLKDQRYWESDLSQTSAFSDFEDMIELKFPGSVAARHGSLVIHAINTKFANAVFDHLFEFLGDESSLFMQAAEHDPEMISVLEQWLMKGSLKAFIWNGTEWRNIGLLKPEANITSFSKLIRFSVPNLKDDTLRIRLTSLADVWKIDAVGLDWTPVLPLQPREVEMRSAVGPEGKDCTPALRNSDYEYAVLFPPEQIELLFDSAKPSRGKKVTYAIFVQGYLHEWFPAKKKHTSTAFVNQAGKGTKVAYLMALLQERSLFLPMIYERWKETKTQYEGR